MPKTLFTSDCHYWHANIIKFCNRPFKTVEEMNEALIAKHNEVVDPEDKIWFIGDLFFCQAREAKSILNRLNGRKHLILGNHDKMIRNQRPVQDLFEAIYPDLHEESIDGVRVVMCHYPMLQWNQSHRGSFMLHGHCHGTCEYPRAARIMDVGVDSHRYSPVSWETIKDTLGEVEVINHKKKDL